MNYEQKFMKLAIKEAVKGVQCGHGGPFGAVIVKDGKVIAKGHNMVVKTNDPTMHAEVATIRKASKKLQRFDLSDCELYTTCEPCPMCLGAIHWAKFKTMYYGATRDDAARLGFDDAFIYDVIKGIAKKQQVIVEQKDREECLNPMEEWENKQDKITY